MVWGLSKKERAAKIFKNLGLKDKEGYTNILTADINLLNELMLDLTNKCPSYHIASLYLNNFTKKYGLTEQDYKKIEKEKIELEQKINNVLVSYRSILSDLPNDILPDEDFLNIEDLEIGGEKLNFLRDAFLYYGCIYLGERNNIHKLFIKEKRINLIWNKNAMLSITYNLVLEFINWKKFILKSLNGYEFVKELRDSNSDSPWQDMIFLKSQRTRLEQEEITQIRRRSLVLSEYQTPTFFTFHIEQLNFLEPIKDEFLIVLNTQTYTQILTALKNKWDDLAQRYKEDVKFTNDLSDITNGNRIIDNLLKELNGSNSKQIMLRLGVGSSQEINEYKLEYVRYSYNIWNLLIEFLITSKSDEALPIRYISESSHYYNYYRKPFTLQEKIFIK